MFINVCIYLEMRVADITRWVQRAKSLNRRADNKMAKKKDKRTNNDLQNSTQKTKD
jgi:hypothetical protein